MPFHQKILRAFLQRIFPMLILCLGAGLAYGQTSLSNPSFEGSPKYNTSSLSGWEFCIGYPDIQPGVFAVTKPPFNGSTYIGLLTDPQYAYYIWYEDKMDVYKESLGQPFTFSAGVTYSFSLNLAWSPSYIDGVGVTWNGAGRLSVWAGTSMCAKSKLIWQSPVATEAWVNHTFNFTPTTNYTYFSVQIEPGVAGQKSNVLVDNLRLNCSTTTAPTAVAAGALATQNRVWDLAQPLNLLTNTTVTGVPAAEVKRTAEYQRDGRTEFTRVISNPTAYRFEAPGTVVLRPAYFCGGNRVNFAAPITITVTDGFNQKIEVKWPGAHVDIFVVCQVSVRRGTQTYWKGTTSSAGRLYVEGLRNGDQLQIRSTKIMRPYAAATYNVTFSAEQATPIVINLAPAYVDLGPP